MTIGKIDGKICPGTLLAILVLLLLPVVSWADILSSDPTPDHPYGWRGDGTGRYPASNPPTTWERRMITPLKELRSLAGKPPDLAGPSGELVTRTKCAFEPPEWLMLAPFPAGTDDNKSLEQKPLENEAVLEPVAGDRVGALAWTLVRATKGIEFFPILGRQDASKLAYLSTWLYCAGGS